ncbi:MAG: aldo/keto reductase [Lentisphaerae bacterium]|nr:aldo/keto reductase [Lentisphaerota bacterium]
MEYRKLGASGIEASAIGFGAWAIGGWMWGGADERDAVAAIHASLDRGITLLDTAPVYGFGRSEEIVGKAIRGRRDKVVLATKCGLVWDIEAGDFHFRSDRRCIKMDATEYKVFKCLRPDIIRRDVETSLNRLGTDRIDLYQTHWQDSTTPIEETVEVLLDLKKQGKIRAIGCSNATTAQMDSYRAAGQLDSDQELYSMIDRDRERTNLDYCSRNGIAFLAYSPLARGLLTGAIGPGRVFDDGDQRSGRPRFSVDNRRRVLALLEELRPFADAHSATFGQLALAWTAAQRGCSHVLAGARNPGQAVENAAASSVRLAGDELAAINAVVERHRGGIA